jgi:hypothetical protein
MKTLASLFIRHREKSSLGDMDVGAHLPWANRSTMDSRNSRLVGMFSASRKLLPS